MNFGEKALNSWWSRTALFIVLALATVGFNAAAQTKDGPQLLFLHVHLKGNSVSLLKSVVRPGQLKPRPSPDISDGLHFELLDAQGKSLWEGAMEDPRSRWVEHEDSANSGKLLRKKIEMRDPEFMVRVPVMAGATAIEFYTIGPSGSQDKRKSLGKLNLPKP